MVGIADNRNIWHPGRLRGPCHRPIIAYAIIIAVTLAIFAPLYYGMAKGRFTSDIPAHAEILQNALQTGRWPPHPGVHILALALLGFPTSPSWKSLIVSLSGITLAALLVKHVLAAVCLSSWKRLGAEDLPQSTQNVTEQQPAQWSPALLAMALCVAGPIWSPEIGWGNFYIGKFSPNLWHNPTLILSWPLVMLHFVGLIKYLSRPSWKLLSLVLACQALATVIKPNYTVTLIGALPLSLVFKSFRSRAWTNAIIAQLAVATIVLLPQWLLLHASNPSAIGFAPFAVVSQRSSFIPLTFLSSVAFPLVSAITFGRAILSRREFQLAGILFAVAVSQAYLLVEHAAGRSILDGNWYWGAHGTLFLLFLVTVVFLYRATLTGTYSKAKIWQCWGIFGLHVASGIAWLVKYFLGFGYF